MMHSNKDDLLFCSWGLAVLLEVLLKPVHSLLASPTFNLVSSDVAADLVGQLLLPFWLLQLMASELFCELVHLFEGPRLLGSTGALLACCLLAPGIDDCVLAPLLKLSCFDLLAYFIFGLSLDVLRSHCLADDLVLKWAWLGNSENVLWLFALSIEVVEQALHGLKASPVLNLVRGNFTANLIGDLLLSSVASESIASHLLLPGVDLLHGILVQLGPFLKLLQGPGLLWSTGAFLECLALAPCIADGLLACLLVLWLENLGAQCMFGFCLQLLTGDW